MPRVGKSAIVPFSAGQMYRLVNAIEDYPRFLPACVDACVHESSNDRLRATIHLQKGPVRLSFTTRNELAEDRRIDLHLEEGPFRRLDGTWRFEPLTDEACRVSLELDYEFTNPLLKATVGKVFSLLAESLVDAFCQRAREVYGKQQ